MISQTIAEKKTTQQFILLDGMMNNKILASEDDRLSCRYMDELFKIEKVIGEIAGVISLQSQVEDDRFTDDAWEEFPEPPPVEEKPK